MGGFPPRSQDPTVLHSAPPADGLHPAPKAPEVTYVLNEVEVRLTGRRAAKDVPVGARPPSELVEVTPVHADDGSWKKWVPRGALFKVLP